MAVKLVLSDGMVVLDDSVAGERVLLAGVSVGPPVDLSTLGNGILQQTVSGGVATYSIATVANQNAKFIIQQPDSSLPNAQAMSALSSGLVKNTTTTGVLSIAVDGVDYLSPATGVVSVSGANPIVATGAHVVTISLATNGVTNNYFRQSDAMTLVGNPTSGVANVQDVSLGSGLGFVGTVLTNTSPVSSLTATAPIVITGTVLSLTTNGTLVVSSGALGRSPITGDVTIAGGSNTSIFRSFAGNSVLARAIASSGVPTELTASADGQVLVRAGGTLTWGTVPSNSVIGTPGGLAYFDGTGELTDQPAIWSADSINNRIGFRTASPAYQLDVIDVTGADDRGIAIRTAQPTSDARLWLFNDLGVLGNVSAGLSYNGESSSTGAGSPNALVIHGPPLGDGKYIQQALSGAVITQLQLGPINGAEQGHTSIMWIQPRVIDGSVGTGYAGWGCVNSAGEIGLLGMTSPSPSVPPFTAASTLHLWNGTGRIALMTGGSNAANGTIGLLLDTSSHVYVTDLEGSSDALVYARASDGELRRTTIGVGLSLSGGTLSAASGPPNTSAYFDGSGNLAGTATFLSVDPGNTRFGSRVSTGTPLYQMQLVDEAGASDRGVFVSTHVSSSSGSLITLQKSRGTYAAPNIVTTADYGGRIGWDLYDGTSYLRTAVIGTHVQPGSTVVTGNVPTHLYFAVTSGGATDPYGSNSPIQLRLNSSGQTVINLQANNTPLTSASSFNPGPALIVTPQLTATTVGSTTTTQGFGAFIGTTDAGGTPASAIGLLTSYTSINRGGLVSNLLQLNAMGQTFGPGSASDTVFTIAVGTLSALSAVPRLTWRTANTSFDTQMYMAASKFQLYAAPESTTTPSWRQWDFQVGSTAGFDDISASTTPFDAVLWKPAKDYVAITSINNTLSAGFNYYAIYAPKLGVQSTSTGHATYSATLKIDQPPSGGSGSGYSAWTIDNAYGFWVGGANTTISARLDGGLQINAQASTAIQVSTFTAGYVKSSSSGFFSVSATIPFSDITGAPTFLGDPGGNGIVVRTASNTTVARSIASDGTITVTNANGVAGNPTLARAAITGDVSIPVTSNVATLLNIPTETTMAGDLLATAIAAPVTPSAGLARIYVDSTSLNLAIKNASGVVNHGVQTLAPSTHLFVTGIAADGTVSAAQPAYSDLSGSVPAITSLTGDVTATGPGAAVATISSHAVTYGKLQLVSAGTLLGNSTGSAATAQEITVGGGLTLSGGVLSATGLSSAFYQVVVVGSTTETQRNQLGFTTNFTGADSASPSRTTIDLATTAVTAGSYSYSSFTVDAYGRLTAASSGAAPVTSVSGTAGNVTSTGGTTPIINLATTAVTSGSYTYGSFTVDAFGRLTAASSGAAPVTSVSGTAGQITSTGGTTPVLNLATTTVAAGSYTNANITVDAFGRVTAASNGSGGGGGGTITAVTATSPLFSSGGATPNITIQGAIVSGSTSTSAQNLGALASGVLEQTVTAGVSAISVFAAPAQQVVIGAGGFLTSAATLTFSSGVLTVGSSALTGGVDVIAHATAATTQYWKDSTPSTAVAVGNGVPGSAPGDDLIFSTDSPGSGWVQRASISNSTGTLTTSSFSNTGTTNLGALTINSLVKTDGSHNLTTATAGVDYVASVSVTSPITNTGSAANPNIGLATSGVSAGSYTNTNITVDAFGRVTSASSGSGGAAFYQTVEAGGSSLTQRGAWNASTGLTAVDNSGAGRTDVSVNLSTGVSGGQVAVGGTGAGEALVLTSTLSSTKGLILFGGTGNRTGWLDESTGKTSWGQNAVDAHMHVVMTADTTSGATTSWDGRHTVFGLSGSTGKGLGVSVNDGNNTVILGALQPNTAWLGMRFNVDHLTVYSAATTAGLFQDLSGNVGVATLSAGGAVYANPGTGQFVVAPASTLVAASIDYSIRLIFNGASTPNGWLSTSSHSPGDGQLAGATIWEYPKRIAAQTAYLTVVILHNSMDGSGQVDINITRNGSTIGSTATVTTTTADGTVLTIGPVAVTSGSITDTYGVTINVTGIVTVGKEIDFASTLVLN